MTDRHFEHVKLRKRVHDALKAEGRAESVTCDLCNDAGWWPANGFSEGERRQICGPRDLNCPGFAGDDDQDEDVTA